MKKLSLLFILVPFTMFAKFYDGTITLNDNTSKTGLIEIPESDSQTIKFKSSNDAKAEKLDINTIKGFQVKNKDYTVDYETMFLAEGGLFTGKGYKIDKKKSWVRIEKRGNAIDLVSRFYSSSGVLGAAGQTSESGSVVYIKRHENDFALFLIPLMGGGFNIPMNFYNALMKTLKYHFEQDCPKLLELITKEELKKNGLGIIVDVHDKNCGIK